MHYVCIKCNKQLLEKEVVRHERDNAYMICKICNKEEFIRKIFLQCGDVYIINEKRSSSGAKIKPKFNEIESFIAYGTISQDTANSSGSKIPFSTEANTKHREFNDNIKKIDQCDINEDEKKVVEKNNPEKYDGSSIKIIPNEFSLIHEDIKDKVRCSPPKHLIEDKSKRTETDGKVLEYNENFENAKSILMESKVEMNYDIFRRFAIGRCFYCKCDNEGLYIYMCTDKFSCTNCMKKIIKQHELSDYCPKCQKAINISFANYLYTISDFYAKEKLAFWKLNNVKYLYNNI